MRYAIIIFALAALWRIGRWAQGRWERFWYEVFPWGVALLILLSAGCATTTPASVSSPIVVSRTNEVTNTMDRIAACVSSGCLESDPAFYGSSLPCPGADVDAGNFAMWHAVSNVPTTHLLNAGARGDTFWTAACEYAAKAGSNEVINLLMSGHGTRQPDTLGDEADGMEEGLCFYDRTYWDNENADRLASCKPANFFIVTDTCHAAGVLRALGIWTMRAVTFGRYQDPRFVPVVLPNAEKLAHHAIIQIAGCREEKYSYGGVTGGTMSQHIDAIREENRAVTRAGLFEELLKRMPKKQQPVWVEIGHVTDEMRFGRAFP